MATSSMPPMHEFFLMHAKADRALRGAISKAIQKSSLTMTEWLALAVIANGPKEGMRMGEVARQLDVTLPQVTALVTTLLDKKLCKQHVFADDRRGRQVLATLKGKRMLVGLEVDTERALKELSKEIDAAQFQAYMMTTKQLSEDTVVVESPPEEEIEPPVVNIDNIDVKDLD